MPVTAGARGVPEGALDEVLAVPGVLGEGVCSTRARRCCRAAKRTTTRPNASNFRVRAQTRTAPRGRTRRDRHLRSTEEGLNATPFFVRSTRPETIQPPPSQRWDRLVERHDGAPSPSTNAPRRVGGVGRRGAVLRANPDRENGSAAASSVQEVFDLERGPGDVRPTRRRMGLKSCRADRSRRRPSSRLTAHVRHLQRHAEPAVVGGARGQRPEAAAIGEDRLGGRQLAIGRVRLHRAAAPLGAGGQDQVPQLVVDVLRDEQGAVRRRRRRNRRDSGPRHLVESVQRQRPGQLRGDGHRVAGVVVAGGHPVSLRARRFRVGRDVGLRVSPQPSGGVVRRRRRSRPTDALVRRHHPPRILRDGMVGADTLG